MDRNYDCVIIGAGPAGLTAGIYASRYGLDTLILEKGAVGGQIVLSSGVENYPAQSVSPGEGVYSETGEELTGRMRSQAEHFGAEIKSAEAVGVSLGGETKEILLRGGERVLSRTAVIAGGASHNPIGCENEERFVGSGISYCAACDANFFAGLDVYVAGGGDSALEEALYLSRIARHVTIIHRRDSFRAAGTVVKKVLDSDRISVIMDTVVEKADGEDVLDKLYLRNIRTGEISVAEADPGDGLIGLFGFTGMSPATALYEGTGLRLDGGYIAAGEDTRTNLPGVFAAGDIRTKTLRQVVTACADGAAAAREAYIFLSK